MLFEIKDYIVIQLLCFFSNIINSIIIIYIVKTLVLFFLFYKKNNTSVFTYIAKCTRNSIIVFNFK